MGVIVGDIMGAIVKDIMDDVAEVAITDVDGVTQNNRYAKTRVNELKHK